MVTSLFSRSASAKATTDTTKLDDPELDSIDTDAVCDFPALHRGVHEGDLALVDSLLRAQHNVNQEATFTNRKGSRMTGVTPLYLAAQRGDEHLINVLLAAGADPTIKVRIDGGRSFTAADVALSKLGLKVWWRLRRSKSGIKSGGGLSRSASANLRGVQGLTAAYV